jgi:hypothetical protein
VEKGVSNGEACKRRAIMSPLGGHLGYAIVGEQSERKGVRQLRRSTSERLVRRDAETKVMALGGGVSRYAAALNVG